MTDGKSRRCKPRKLDPNSDLRPSDPLAAFFALAVLYLLAAALTVVLSQFTDIGNARWIALHLAFVGGVSQLILGAAQFFAGAFLATGPPPRSYIRAQFVFWNLGTVALVLGGPSNSLQLTATATVLLIAALGSFKFGLRAQRKQSLQRVPWATRWYQAAAGFLVLGAIIGALFAAGVGWSYGNLISAHITLNVIGWFGTSIVGTLHTYFPSLSGTLLRFPKLQRYTYYSWLAGTTVLASGFAFSLNALIFAGLVLLFISSTLIFSNIVGSAVTAFGGLLLPAKLVGAAQLFLPLGLLFMLTALPLNSFVFSGAVRSTAATLLLAGWVGLTVVGSLIHLLAVLSRIRNLSAQSRAVRFPVEFLLVPAGVGAVVLIAVAQLLELEWLLLAATVVAALILFLLVTVVLRLALRMVKAAPLRL